MGNLSLLGLCVGGLGALVSVFCVGYVVSLVRHRASIVGLADLPAEAPPGGWPRLAVLFAARDEAKGVERATRSLVTQDYPELEVIAVDDRSTDGTGPILDGLAREFPRLRVEHVRELPPGWLGKNHALHVAASTTSADWLLLTDADVVFAPGALRKAVAEAVRSDAGHVTVAPQVPTEGPGERLFMAMFLLMFSFHAPPWKVEDPRSGAHLGIGAFNLVRADAWRALGGFSHMGLTVDDDMRLGRALKSAGYRTRVLLGTDAVSVRWQVGLGGMIRGLEKNFFAAAEFRVVLAVAGALALLTLGCTPYAGLFVGPWWMRVICAAGVAAICVIVSSTGRPNGIGWYYGLTIPLSTLLVVWALLRSTALTLWRGGVRWRDHHYPLTELREHARLRNAWIRGLKESSTSGAASTGGTPVSHTALP